MLIFIYPLDFQGPAGEKTCLALKALGPSEVTKATKPYWLLWVWSKEATKATKVALVASLGWPKMATNAIKVALVAFLGLTVPILVLSGPAKPLIPPWWD